MSASNNFITRPVLSTVCSLLIVIVGLIAIPILPIENLPDIAPPTVKVQSTYVGADAVAVEQGCHLCAGAADQRCGKDGLHHIHELV
jgi:HAE1 family hydrophobic/amphiphilic exporter-1